MHLDSRLVREPGPKIQAKLMIRALCLIRASLALVSSHFRDVVPPATYLGIVIDLQRQPPHSVASHRAEEARYIFQTHNPGAGTHGVLLSGSRAP